MNYERIARLFNLSEADVGAIQTYQKGCCAICGRILKSKPNIDHRHLDGLVRGILCHLCNRALGLFRDNPKLLLAAIAYLADPPAVRALGEQRFGRKGRTTNKRRAGDATGRRRKQQRMPCKEAVAT